MAQSHVLLGVTDQRITSDSEVNWSVSKIGGSPSFPTPSSSPPLPRCGGCRDALALVVQVYCPLEASVYHRDLYVFACTNKPCWNQPNSWAVLRSQHPDQQSHHGNQLKRTQPESSNHSNTMSDDWGTGDADWGDDDEEDKTEAVSMTTEWADDADDWGDAEESSCGPIAQFQQMSIDEANQEESDVSKHEVAMSISQSILCDLLDPGQLNAQKDTDSMSSSTASNQAETLAGTSDSVSSTRLSGEANTEKLSEAAQSGASKLFASYYISVFDEPQFEKEELVHERKLLAEYSQKEGGDFCDNLDDVHRKGKRKGGEGAEKSQRHSAGGGGGESYEKALPKHGDRTFSKFAKQLALCPEQILRYSYGGSPCYIRQPASVSVPSCQYCGAARLYELQLMPALVNFLHGDDHGQEMCVEFGTVLVFTCSQSCWQDSDLCKQEYVIVQPDPDQHLFKT